MAMDRNEFGWRKTKSEQGSFFPHGNKATPEKITEDAESLSLKSPCMYEVFVVHDEQTPMDFATMVLQKFFYKSQEEATYVTLEAHRRGQGLCGKFTRDVAETKITLVNDYAHKYNYPLKCVMQKESCHVIKKP